MYRLFLAAALLTVVGCSPSLGDTYSAHIDPSFTDTEKEHILAALDDWSANVPVQLSAFIETCQGTRGQQICVHKTTHEELVSEHGADDSAYAITYGSSSGEDVDGAEVWIGSDTIPADSFQGVLAHEIGHGMGLEHETSTREALLMAPSSLQDWSQTVTPGDTAQWYGIRGRTAPSGATEKKSR